MADNDFTAQNNATPEQLVEQFPCNVDPFGVWYCIDVDAGRYKWAVNDENGDGFTNVLDYRTASILSEALRIRHKKISTEEIVLDIEQQKEINHALLIGLESFGEIERIDDEVGKYDLMPNLGKIPESIRPLHPTGTNDTISTFAAALRYIQRN